jgi:Flp pilus assembly protein TadG
MCLDSKPLNLNSRRGQSLVEFALVLPVLIVVLMAIFDFGFGIYTYNVLSNAAREGARYGIIATKTDTQIKNTVISKAVGVPLNASQITITPSPTRTSGGTITVRITYPFAPITPLIGQVFGPSGVLTLTAQATMNVE